MTGVFRPVIRNVQSVAKVYLSRSPSSPGAGCFASALSCGGGECVCHSGIEIIRFIRSIRSQFSTFPVFHKNASPSPTTAVDKNGGNTYKTLDLYHFVKVEGLTLALGRTV